MILSHDILGEKQNPEIANNPIGNRLLPTAVLPCSDGSVANGRSGALRRLPRGSPVSSDALAVGARQSLPAFCSR
nr:hypothetical protein Iba_chr03aCG2980 [Ipomoea batatas]